VRDVLIVKRKSIPARNFIQVDSVLYLVLIQFQDIEIFTWAGRIWLGAVILSKVHLSVIAVPFLTDH